VFSTKTKPQAPVPKFQKIKNITNKFNVKVKLLGKGQIISEDAVNKVDHTKTFKCKSLTGVLLVMPVLDFYQRIKRDHEDTWKLIREINEKKHVKNPERIAQDMLFTKTEKSVAG